MNSFALIDALNIKLRVNIYKFSPTMLFRGLKAKEQGFLGSVRKGDVHFQHVSGGGGGARSLLHFSSNFDEFLHEGLNCVAID